MATAAAAVKDTAYIEEIRQHNATWRERIAVALTALGIEVIPSQANFYLLRFAEGSGKTGSDAAAFLQSRGIIPRPAGGSDQFLRITVGLDHENEAVLSALTDYMSAA
jgi:histidinol-phosphate aminotransferase